MRSIQYLCFAMTLGISLNPVAHANPDFLPAEQAFQFSAESISKQKAQLKWEIAAHYYLYHDQFKVLIDSQDDSAKKNTISLKLPQGHQKNDPTFGVTEVHYDAVTAEFIAKPNTTYTVYWQGCSQDGLCYPLQNKTIKTDADGLLAQEWSSLGFSNRQLLNSSANNHANLLGNNAIDARSNSSVSSSDASSTSDLSQIDQSQILQDSAIEQQDLSNTDLNDNPKNQKANISQSNVSSTSLQWNDDQSFFNLLSKDSIFLNLLIFLALGVLLAFLPCSLPLIPIISTLIIQRRTGYKAVAIVSSFIMSMAVVYGLMGVFVAEIGYSFQRWFQSPMVISAFALLFVIFALNLFGLFQLSLPQKWINTLNQFQNKQKAGTLLGSIGMGALSALIVGPCMSAPLAGALLFVSQSHSAVLGGLYLFVLGLGIGLPLLIASLFGTRLLPKPGLWMNHLKVCFGFMMLCMAIYFIRPMLSQILYSGLLVMIALGLAIYLIKVFKDTQTALNKGLVIFAIMASIATTFYFAYQAYLTQLIVHQYNDRSTWQQVSTETALNQALEQARAQQKLAIVDVYADWCVACQPLEKEVFPRADVQRALHDFVLIKLDLSTYEKSQDLILKQHEILGPPTLLIFNAEGQEIRDLRLTGTFKAEQLIQQLQKTE